jgi:hypothetical protein
MVDDSGTPRPSILPRADWDRQDAFPQLGLGIVQRQRLRCLRAQRVGTGQGRVDVKTGHETS